MYFVTQVRKKPKRSQTQHYVHSVLRNGGKSGLNIIFKLLFKWKSELHFWVLFSCSHYQNYSVGHGMFGIL